MTTPFPTLILASASPYRKQLLERLGLDIECHPANVDESPLPNETPHQLAGRLASNKARTVGAQHEEAWIIGSDQVAELDGCALGKPGNATKAAEQLRNCSGKTVVFHTGLSPFRHSDAREHHCVERYAVTFRPLSDDQIERYITAEPAFDCAGSFKMEGLGISLFSALSGRDPNSLIGLPLIRLINFLNKEGYTLP